MPIERQRWAPSPALDGPTNAQLRRRVEVLDTADRVDVQSVTATATLAITFPLTLVLVDTTAGNVTLTLPPALTVPGFRLEVKKMTAANTVTLDAHASETIDGAATLAFSTAYQSYRLVSTGTQWVIV